MTAQATVTKLPVRTISARHGIYQVESRRTRGTWYTVNLSANSCNCQAGAFGFKNCKNGACAHVVVARHARALQQARRVRRPVVLSAAQIDAMNAMFETLASKYFDQPLHAYEVQKESFL